MEGLEIKKRSKDVYPERGDHRSKEGPERDVEEVREYVVEGRVVLSHCCGNLGEGVGGEPDGADDEVDGEQGEGAEIW